MEENKKVMERLQEIEKKLEVIEKNTEKAVVILGAFANEKLEEFTEQDNPDKIMAFIGITKMVSQVIEKSQTVKKKSKEEDAIAKFEEFMDTLNNL